MTLPNDEGFQVKSFIYNLEYFSLLVTLPDPWYQGTLVSVPLSLGVGGFRSNKIYQSNPK